MKEKIPSIIIQARNLVSAVSRSIIRVLSSYDLFVPDVIYERRWNKCLKCDKLTQKHKCEICGCNMQRKCKWASEWCREGKWGTYKTISIIIPQRNDPYLEQTLKYLHEQCSKEYTLQVLVADDNEGIGRRIIINNAVRQATGEYLFFIDAHCRMLSDGWDKKLAEETEEKDITVCVIGGLNENFEDNGTRHTACYLNKDMVEKWRREVFPDQEIELMMGFTGCGWMIRKSRFQELGGYNELWSKYGGDGPEWSLKNWLSGGEIKLHKGVVCGHIFQTNDNEKLYPIDVEEMNATYEEIRKTAYGMAFPLQKYSPQYLFKKFNSPDLQNIIKLENIYAKGGLMSKRISTKTIRRQTLEIKDESGKVIKKIVKVFESLEEDKITKLKVANLQEDNTWKFIVLTDPQDIEMWLFENED